MKKLVMFLSLVVIMSSFVFAGIDIGNVSDNIETSYAPETNIRGWINVSFDEEPVDSTFEDEFGNSINLIDLLDANFYVYDCSTEDCGVDYDASNGESNKNYVVSGSDSILVGLEFTQEIVDITDISFVIDSNASASCSNQLEIDILADGIIDTGNTKVGGANCPQLETYGCFDVSKSTQEYRVGYGSTMHCQRMTLAESPGFELGAWVRRNVSSKNLKMAIYDLNLVEVEGAVCDLGQVQNGSGEESCNVDYLVKDTQEYYLCIYAEEEEEGEGSKIRGSSETEDGCGFFYTGGINEIFAWEMFARGLSFAPVGTLNIENDLGGVNSFAETVKNYIIDKYSNLKCSLSEECVIPILINSGKGQTLDLNNLVVQYVSLGGTTELTRFHDLTQIPAKVSSDYQELYLDAGNFSVPDDYGNYTFELLLNGEDEIITKDVFVENVPTFGGLSPTLTISAFPTPFEIGVNMSMNINQFKWEFGDGVNMTTTTNKATHTYNSTGQYELKITIIDSLGLSSYKAFSINVGSPESVINQTLKTMQSNLANITLQINGFDVFTQTSINNLLDTDEMDDDLKNLQTSFSGANSEAEYNQVMTDLLKLKIPESFSTPVTTGAITFYPLEEMINLDIISSVAGGSYESSKEDGYINALFAWHQKNIETKVSFSEVAAIYDGVSEHLLRTFKIDISEKGSLSEDPNFFIEDLDGLLFKENYLENENAGYIHIDLTNLPISIYFSTTEQIGFEDLSVFIAPSLDRLEVLDVCVGDECDERDKGIKGGLFILILILLLIVGAVVYVVLQEWYKKKYEGYLFKNQNNLYNLINYVQAEKKKGTKDGEMKSKLKKSGWTSEQIRYVMRKHSGKKTGMLFDIPIKRVVSKFGNKKPKTIQGKHGVNSRFGQPGRMPSRNFNNKKGFLKK